MARWFDRYYGPDLVVGRPREAQRALEAKLGIPAGQNMRMTMHGGGFDVAYLQVNEDFGLSASCIQLMGIRPLAGDEPHNETGRMVRAMILAYITAQRMDRPIITHVQALSAPTEDDITAITEMLRSRGVPHITLMKNVYIGLVEEDGRIRYDPSADAGTYLEWAPTVQTDFPGFVLPPSLPENPEVADLKPGTMVGPVARTQIVKSAAAVIDRLRWMLDWPEEGDVEYREADGQRSIVLKPRNGISAVWEFVEPTRRDSRAGKVLDRYGEGPWTIRIGVFGLDAKLADLESRGTRWKDIDDGPGGVRRVAINRWDIHGIPIELEEMPVVYRGVGQGRGGMTVTGSPFDLSGRQALVTGAASGIGRQAAIRLAGAGAQVVCADIDEQGAAATAGDITAAGGAASAVALDVCDRDRVHEVVGAGPDLNILCNVAGILRHAPVEELTEADLDRVLAVNLKSVLFCAQAAVAGMRRAGSASIINLASAAIDSIAPNLAAYAMSKAAIAQLTRNMATEWAPYGIRVNAVAPGFVDTSMTAHSYRDDEGRVDAQKREEHLARMREFAPLRIVGEADDVAAAIWFLAADASRYMTGQILRPNGGIAMPW